MSGKEVGGIVKDKGGQKRGRMRERELKKRKISGSKERREGERREEHEKVGKIRKRDAGGVNRGEEAVRDGNGEKKREG